MCCSQSCPALSLRATASPGAMAKRRRVGDLRDALHVGSISMIGLADLVAALQPHQGGPSGVRKRLAEDNMAGSDELERIST